MNPRRKRTVSGKPVRKLTPAQKAERARASEALEGASHGRALPNYEKKLARPSNLILADLLGHVKVSKGTLLSNLQRNPKFKATFLEALKQKGVEEPEGVTDLLCKRLSEGKTPEQVIVHLRSWKPEAK